MEYSNTTALRLADEKLPNIKIHATVLFSILNHFMRRKEDRMNMRVVGSLLGVSSTEGGVDYIEVTNCFPLLHDEVETDKEIHVNVYDTINIGSDKINYYDDMVRYHESIDRRESIIGWYCTSTDGTLDTYAKLIDESICLRSDAPPVGIIVNTTLEGRDQIGARAYIGDDIKLGKELLAKVFHELSVQVIFSPGEALCIQHMISGKDTWELDTQTVVKKEEINVKNAIKNLTELINKVIKYVDEVIDEPTKGSVAV